MSQQTAPFLEGKYGWNYGENGWNQGADENFLKFSFMFDKNIDGIVSSLPAAVSGQAYFLTTDLRLYFAVGSTWYSSPIPKWFNVTLRSTGASYVYNGSALVALPSTLSLEQRVEQLEVEYAGLGTAALKDTEYFASKAQLDVQQSQQTSYTDNKVIDLQQNLLSVVDYSKGISLVGGGYRVVSTITEALSLNKTVAHKVFILGYTTPGDGGGGAYYMDTSDTTTASDGGTILVTNDGGRLKMVNPIGTATVHTFGAKADGVSNDSPAIQACVNWALTWNGVVRCPRNNYFLNTGITVANSTFRTVKFEGNGQGTAQTASSAGTCFVVTGNKTVITATFNAFANENIKVEGICFYNTSLSQTGGGVAVKLIRGSANGRYISGFLFKNIGIMGFGAGFIQQGMNTVQSALNYFGTIVYDNVTIQNTGMAYVQYNACCNLVSWLNCVSLGCKYGGICNFRDGDVGAGNGLGSMTIGTLIKSHMEGVGGMFRSDTTVVMDSGQPVRTVFTLIDFTHESCGQSVDPVVAGEPFALGVNTDIHVIGHVVDGISYGEAALPYLNSTARIWCDSRMRVIVNGGKIMTAKTVNAPSIYRNILTGNNTVITIPLSESTPYGIKSTLVLGAGAGGIIESQHTGQAAGSPTRVAIAGAPASGLTLTWGTTAGGGAIQLTIANTSGFTYSALLTIENLSSASITVASEY